MAWDFELVAGPTGGPADGLVWDGEALIYADMGASCIQRYDPKSNRVTILRAHWTRMKGLALGGDGMLYGCQSGSRRLVRFNADGSASPLQARLDGQMPNCPDDMAIDRQGRIWFSDPRDEARGPEVRPMLDHASVLRAERAGWGMWSLTRLTFDTTCPRGILLSPDERSLFVAENPPDLAATPELRAYPVQDDGTLGAGRVLHRFVSGERGIDGMCLDRAGAIIACVGSSRSGPEPLVYVISPDGQVVETQTVPAEEPVDCAFGDVGLRTLYVSTAEGHLYRVRNSGYHG
jgi:gluconolactonase